MIIRVYSIKACLKEYEPRQLSEFTKISVYNSCNYLSLVDDRWFVVKKLFSFLKSFSGLSLSL